MIRMNEIASLTLVQACSYQEKLNSEMAIADYNLRNLMASNLDSNKQVLLSKKKELEELALALSDHIEELSLA